MKVWLVKDHKDTLFNLYFLIQKLYVGLRWSAWKTRQRRCSSWSLHAQGGQRLNSCCLRQSGTFLSAFNLRIFNGHWFKVNFPKILFFNNFSQQNTFSFFFHEEFRNVSRVFSWWRVNNQKFAKITKDRMNTFIFVKVTLLLNRFKLSSWENSNNLNWKVRKIQIGFLIQNLFQLFK